jgi:hypothetical protein
MHSRLISASTCVALLLAAGCAGDRTTPPPAAPLETGPSLSQQDPLACDVIEAQSLAKQYFPQFQFTLAKELIFSISVAGPRTPAARDAGFDLLRLVAEVVQAGTAGSPVTGSALTNETIKCMFQPADFPAVFPADFTAALDPNGDGAFEVRGPEGDDDSPVLARGSFAFAGVAPQADMSWTDALDEEVLIVGKRTGTETYDWSMVRPAAAFDPPVVVGICVESGATSMLVEENVGVLAFVDPSYFLPCPNLIAAGPAPVPARPFARLARLAVGWLAPTSLHATSLMPGGTGGLAGGLRSVFSTLDLATTGDISLAFTVQPVNGVVNQPLAPVQVRATTARGVPVAGVQITLASRFPANLSGTTTLVTGPDGSATFADLRVDRVGETELKAQGTVVGRSAIVVRGKGSNRFTVGPAD